MIFIFLLNRREFIFLFLELLLCFRHFEEKATELEATRGELQGRIEELEEENEHLKRQQLMEGEVKRKLREETSQLTAENMVCPWASEVECDFAEG